MTDGYTRRDVLRTGAGAGGVAALGSLAGCSSVPFVGGGGMNISQWLYAPGTFTDRDHYFFTHHHDRAIRNNEDEFDSNYFERQEASENEFPLDQMDVDYDSVTGRLRLPSGGIVSASFDRSDVLDELDDNDFDEEDDDYAGYAIYQKDELRAVGVSNNDAVYVQPAIGAGVDDVVDAVETIIDTRTGDEDRYAAESDDMQTLLNQVGDEDVLIAGTQEEVDDGAPSFGQFEGQVGVGYGATFDGETTNLTYTVVFADADDVDADDVEEFVEDATDALDFIESFEDVGDIESTQNGRTAVVTGTMDTDEYGT